MKALFYITILALSSTCLQAQDKGISNQISAQLAGDTNAEGLFYPASVQRFYLANDFQPAWIKPQAEMGKTWQAMLLLDCVLQFGLAHADYHPYELSYDSLRTMLQQPEKWDAQVKARFDIVLTDAMISLMNHLHYGKLNPEYPADKIDRGTALPFLTENKLCEALSRDNFMECILGVQPQDQNYVHLQHYMQLVKGQYQGDCYEIPEADVRLVAINMERLRWANFPKRPFIHVNIPSYTLELCEPDSVYSFKIAVGRPRHNSAATNCTAAYLTAAPIRSLAHSAIRVQKVTALASLLLRYDGQADRISLLRKDASYDLNRMPMLKRPFL